MHAAQGIVLHMNVGADIGMLFKFISHVLNRRLCCV